MKKMLWLILMLIFIYFYFDFLNSDYFLIKTINVNKDLELKLDFTNESYLDVLKKLKGKNIWLLDTKLIEERIKEDVRIKDIKINKKFPSSLDLILEEEEPFTKIKYNNELFFLNNNDKIFALDKEIKSDNDIILNIDNLEELKILKNSLDKIRRSKASFIVSDIFLDSKDNIILTLIDGTKILSDYHVESEKYETAFALYKKLRDSNKKIKYIDIRFVDFICLPLL